jgi:hypothetical protein
VVGADVAGVNATVILAGWGLAQDARRLAREVADSVGVDAARAGAMALGRAPIRSVAPVIMNHQDQGRQCTFINNYEEDDNKTTTSLALLSQADGGC